MCGEHLREIIDREVEQGGQAANGDVSSVQGARAITSMKGLENRGGRTFFWYGAAVVAECRVGDRLRRCTRQSVERDQAPFQRGSRHLQFVGYPRSAAG